MAEPSEDKNRKDKQFIVSKLYIDQYLQFW